MSHDRVRPRPIGDAGAAATRRPPGGGARTCSSVPPSRIHPTAGLRLHRHDEDAWSEVVSASPSSRGDERVPAPVRAVAGCGRGGGAGRRGRCSREGTRDRRRETLLRSLFRTPI